MRHRDGIRHILLCLVRRIAEHHSLVSGSDGVNIFLCRRCCLCFERLIHAESNICGLLVDHRNHAAGLRVKSVIRAGISDVADRIAHDLLHIYIGIGGDLSHNHHHTGRSACLAGNAAHGILLHKRIQDGIGNLVAHLIRMSLCN